MRKHVFQFLWFFSLVVGLSSSAAAERTIDIEASYVIPGYNDVAIPGDDGTRFSLTEDLEADDFSAFRVRYGQTIAEKHWIGLLVAPLTLESDGTLDKDVDFDGESFAAGTPVKSTFRFDSYRLIYRYLVHQSDTWKVSLGGAAKVRDAEIELKGDGRDAKRSDTGFVPLFSFNVTYMPSERCSLFVDGEALAAAQGRAEDILFAAQYDVSDALGLYAGYRILEGGADNDDVYTFSLFHYITLGATLSF